MSDTPTAPGTPTSPAPTSAGGPRRRRSTVIRAITGLAIPVVAAGVVLGARDLPEPQAVAQDFLDVAVPAAPTVLSCPAEPSAPEAVGDGEFAGTSDLTVRTDAVAVPREEGEALTAVLEPEGSFQDGEVLTATTSQAPAVVRVTSQAEASPLAAAATLARADSGDLRGLSAAACQLPGADAWLLGGQTGAGSSAELTLDNPGATPATVSVRAWGPTGEVALAGASEVLVPAGERATVLMEAVAADQERLAVHVEARGGQVAASMRVNQLDGLTAAGTDLVTAASEPSTSALIPGVVLGSSASGDEDAGVVRILNPGAEPATVHLELLSADGVERISGDEGYVVEPNTVWDASLAGTPPGTYAVRVVSDEAVVSGVGLLRRGQPAPEDPDVPVTDRAWLPSVSAATDLVLMTPGLGEEVTGAEVVVADISGEGGEVTLRPITAEGEVGVDLDVRLAPDGVAVVSQEDLADLVDPGARILGVLGTSETPVAASTLLTAEDDLGELLSAVPGQPDPQVARSVSLRLSID